MTETGENELHEKLLTGQSKGFGDSERISPPRRRVEMTCCLRDRFFVFVFIIYILFVKESLLQRDTDNKLVGLVIHILKILL